MADLWLANDAGNVVFIDGVVYKKLGTDQHLPTGVIGGGDVADIQEFTYNVADNNGKVVYTDLQRAVSRYLYFSAQYAAGVNLVVPAHGIVRLWTSFTWQSMYIDGIAVWVSGSGPTTEAAAIPVAVIPGQTVSTGSNGSWGYCAFLPHTYPIS